MSSTTIHQHLEGYHALRSGLGYRVNGSDRSLLQGFAGLVEKHGRPIRAEMVLNWACGPKAVAAVTRAYRLSSVRGFLLYLRTFWPETEIPSCGLLAKGRRPKPYIYSEQQITALMAATQLITWPAFARRARRDQPLRPHTQKTLIGLLASTGLRVSEALHLDLDDVRLRDDPPHLVVRRTKFRKNRIVPVHPSVAEMLQRYLQRRRELGYDGFTPAFFVSEQGRRLTHPSFVRTWRTLLSLAGVEPTEDGRRPTIHAIRHTFAVRRLVEWQRRGLNVTALLPHLSVYLGHVAPKNTYWYLSATPELLGLAAQSFEQYAVAGGAR